MRHESKFALSCVLGCGKVYDYQETPYQDGCIRFVLSVRPDWIQCPACSGLGIFGKGRRLRELQTVPIGLSPVSLVTEVPKTGVGPAANASRPPRFFHGLLSDTLVGSGRLSKTSRAE
jgi:hypothetical protein